MDESMRNLSILKEFEESSWVLGKLRASREVKQMPGNLGNPWNFHES